MVMVLTRRTDDVLTMVDAEKLCWNGCGGKGEGRRETQRAGEEDDRHERGRVERDGAIEAEDGIPM